MLALTAALVLFAAGLWAFLFLPPDETLWRRTWIAAGLGIAGGLGAVALDGRLDTFVGPVDAVEVGIGLGVGGAWLVATQIGFRVLCSLFPTVMSEVRELYSKGSNGRLAEMVPPVMLMGVAEEVLFRGALLGTGGLVVATVAYAVVQVVERKWVLVLAALLCGAVWGALAVWRDGLVAPAIAHVLWTTTLLTVWPLPDCRVPGATADETAAAGAAAG